MVVVQLTEQKLSKQESSAKLYNENIVAANCLKNEKVAKRGPFLKKREGKKCFALLQRGQLLGKKLFTIF